ncbi:MAG: hypothetical protein M3Q69_02040 [Acidobacteriota bacterium]|nr:hypothetical protein [Acidobacteriota bacterium]
MKGSTSELHTFELRRQEDRIIATMPLSAAGKPIVHVLGEAHIGGSQISVAQVLCKLLREHEIDALLVEQAENTRFNPPRPADGKEAEDRIAALQYALVRLSSGFDFAVKNAKQVQASVAAGTTPSRKVTDRFRDASIASQLYEKNASISAMDYVFAASHLRGKPLPMYGIESAELRKQFSELDDQDSPEADRLMQQRDIYMAQRVQEIIAANAYKRVVVICGALHLPSLPDEIQKRGSVISVDYRAPVDRSFKPPTISSAPPEVMEAILSRSVHVLAPPPSFKPRLDMTIPSGPSAELVAFIRRVANGNEAIYDNLVRDYSANATSGVRTLWQAKSVTDRSIVLRRTSAGVIEAVEQRQVPTLLPDRWEKQSRSHLLFDYASSTRAATLADRNPHVRVITVEDKGDRYLLYSGSADPLLYEGNDFAALMSEVESRSGAEATAVYLDLKNFSDMKREAFTSNCRRNASGRLSVRDFGRRNVDDVRLLEILVEPGAKVVEATERSIEEVTHGPRKGWFRLVVDFFVRTGDRVTRVAVTFYAKTRATLSGLDARFTSVRGNPTLHAAMSVAEMIEFARADLDARNIIVEASLAREVKTSIIADLEARRTATS